MFWRKGKTVSQESYDLVTERLHLAIAMMNKADQRAYEAESMVRRMQSGLRQNRKNLR